MGGVLVRAWKVFVLDEWHNGSWPVGQPVNPLVSGLTYSPSQTHWPTSYNWRVVYSSSATSVFIARIKASLSITLAAASRFLIILFRISSCSSLARLILRRLFVARQLKVASIFRLWCASDKTRSVFLCALRGKQSDRIAGVTFILFWYIVQRKPAPLFRALVRWRYLTGLGRYSA